MDYKQKLIEIINEKKTSILGQSDYLKANSLLQKLDDVEKDFNKIELLTSDELLILSDDKLRRVVEGIKAFVKFSAFDDDEIKKWLLVLKDDINNNIIKNYDEQFKIIDELIDMVNSGNYSDNYEALLSFIKDSYESGVINVNDAINLNFYLLNECSKQRVETTIVVDDEITSEDDVAETIELLENEDDIENKLREIFSLHGYDYDSLGRMKTKFNKYVKVEYLDYVLYKFKYYGISAKDIKGYSKTLFRILIDNDRETFDAICKFIDENGCSLRYLLAIPSIFSKNRRKYVPKNVNLNGPKSKVDPKDDKDFEIDGSFDYFFKNVDLYKKLNKKRVISDEDLMKSAKFLGTPSSLIEKNLKLLLKYKIVARDDFPASSVSLCGVHTEYLIDRFIEAGLYESYLSLSSTVSGSKPRGSSYLAATNRPYKFYKIKMANDIGESIMATNGGIRSVFNDDNMDYYGIKLRTNENGEYIVQEPLSSSLLESIKPSVRRKLSANFYWDSSLKKFYDEKESALLESNNLYKYRTYSPLDIFPKDDLKGEILNKIFMDDFKNVDIDSSMEEDEFINLLDKTIYTDSNGVFHQIKTSEFKYEFASPAFPNLKVIVSRQKVIRLLSLLKNKNFKLDNNLPTRTKVDILLSVVLKDTIVSDYEKSMVRFVIGLIVERKLNLIGEFERGARRC